MSRTKDHNEAAYIQLYKKLRDEILKGAFPYGTKLPSKRTMSSDYDMSLVTVEHALDLLIDEGYIEPRERSGYFIAYRESDGFASAATSSFASASAAFSSPSSLKSNSHPTIDYSEVSSLFPFSTLAKTMRKVLSDYGDAILTKSPNEGCPELRNAISLYLARSRSIKVSPDQIIIGSGAEYLYGQIVQILGRNLIYGIEKPSYEKIEQVYKANGIKPRLLSLGHDGILSNELDSTDAQVLHITPYRSYPSGVTANASKRHEYIRWVDSGSCRFIVEDDFESEFTPSRKPEETVFSLSKKENVIYLNTFSKTIAPGIRIGYMVLPEKLLKVYKKQAGFYSCAVPVFEQYVLAEFINSGDFERHINRVRRHNRGR